MGKYADAERPYSGLQETLVSGTNIKTINSQSLLGAGDIVVGGGSFSGDMDDIPDGATYVKTENNFTDAEKSKLTGIESGAEVNNISDGNATDLTDGGATTLHKHSYNNLDDKPTIISLLDVYPVGSIYISTSSTNPNTLFGGTWTAFGAGKVLVSLDSGDSDFDTSEKTGGAKTVQSSAQTFAGNALGNHNHGVTGVTVGNESAHTHSVTSNVTSAANTGNESSHTHTYTQVPNHVHVQNINSGTTGANNGYGKDTSTSGSEATAISTANPTGGVASGTTSAGSSHNHTSPALTNNAVTSGAGSAHNHSLSNNVDDASAGTPSGTMTAGAATSVVQPYIVVYMFKRTA